jgi:RHS repeat-associated protein
MTEFAACASRCTGKERDEESKLDYFGARYFGSTMGRFTSPDPTIISTQRILDPQQWNMYSYARNEPLGHIDPEGNEVKVYTETGGVGHTFVVINNGNHNVLFSYGRYAGGSSGSNLRGANPVGPGILIRVEGKEQIDDFLADRSKSDPSLDGVVVSVKNEEAVYQNLQARFDAGKPLNKQELAILSRKVSPKNAREVEQFNLLTNNCTTTTCDALRQGGGNVPHGIVAPEQIRSLMHPEQQSKQQYGFPVMPPLDHDDDGRNRRGWH